MKNTLYLFGLITLISACRQESNQLSNINVDTSFKSFVESFIEEGAKRGHDINFEDTGLTIQFGNTPNASASCHEIGNSEMGSHQIFVNQRAWQSLNDSLRERLIFHELGHCELGRSHRNDKFNDGSWQSMMRGDPIAEIDEQLPIPYFGFRRDYYIDELFDGAVALPDWANKGFEYAEIPTESKELIIDQSDLSFLNDTIDFEVENYELEFEVKTVAGDDATWFAWGTEAQHYFFWLQHDVFHFAANSGFQGPFHSIKNDSLDFRETQKITIRQNGYFCKVFLNETFFFMVDRLPADLFFVMSSTENEVEVERYKLSKIF